MAEGRRRGGSETREAGDGKSITAELPTAEGGRGGGSEIRETGGGIMQDSGHPPSPHLRGYGGQGAAPLPSFSLPPGRRDILVPMGFGAGRGWAGLWKTAQAWSGMSSGPNVSY